MSTVRELYGLSCPTCGCDEDLAISVQIWIDVFPDGTLESLGSFHEWHEMSPCRCTQCMHRGIVRDFTVETGGPS